MALTWKQGSARRDLSTCSRSQTATNSNDRSGSYCAIHVLVSQLPTLSLVKFTMLILDGADVPVTSTDTLPNLELICATYDSLYSLGGLSLSLCRCLRPMR